ncbi:MAG: hypothetical protein NZ602_14250 [Thermoguttaceae bacterium]|nr:hypothetical protein [Thermoguttaceae bacterium]MDW8039610.1 hypothetical protein [Thermoguttaceae bacterium]
MNGNSSENIGVLLMAVVDRLQGLIQTLRADQERLSVEQLRAALRTAEAVEEMARQGIKLQEVPTAVWGP